MIASPLPLGITVRILEEGKAPRPLPLIFVLEHAANTREVQSGWYISAEVGHRFDIVVTNIHEKGGVYFRGERIQSDRSVVIYLSMENVRRTNIVFLSMVLRNE